MSNSFNGKISKKDFFNEIKDCKTFDLKDFKKEIISEEFDEETGISTTILKVQGQFSSIMKKMIKPVNEKDSILELILKELKEIKTDVAELKNDVAELKNDVAKLKNDVAELKNDVAELKQDVADIKVRVSNLEKDVSDIKRCPTIKKELAELS